MLYLPPWPPRPPASASAAAPVRMLLAPGVFLMLDLPPRPPASASAAAHVRMLFGPGVFLMLDLPPRPPRPPASASAAALVRMRLASWQLLRPSAFARPRGKPSRVRFPLASSSHPQFSCALPIIRPPIWKIFRGSNALEPRAAFPFRTHVGACPIPLSGEAQDADAAARISHRVHTNLPLLPAALQG
jgi:hypothetical protein